MYIILYVQEVRLHYDLSKWTDFLYDVDFVCRVNLNAVRFGKCVHVYLCIYVQKKRQAFCVLLSSKVCVSRCVSV